MMPRGNAPAPAGAGVVDVERDARSMKPKREREAARPAPDHGGRVIAGGAARCGSQEGGAADLVAVEIAEVAAIEDARDTLVR